MTGVQTCALPIPLPFEEHEGKRGWWHEAHYFLCGGLIEDGRVMEVWPLELVTYAP